MNTKKCICRFEKCFIADEHSKEDFNFNIDLIEKFENFEIIKSIFLKSYFYLSDKKKLMSLKINSNFKLKEKNLPVDIKTKKTVKYVKHYMRRTKKWSLEAYRSLPCRLGLALLKRLSFSSIATFSYYPNAFKAPGLTTRPVVYRGLREIRL